MRTVQFSVYRPIENNNNDGEKCYVIRFLFKNKGKNSQNRKVYHQLYRLCIAYTLGLRRLMTASEILRTKRFCIEVRMKDEETPVFKRIGSMTLLCSIYDQWIMR